MIKPRKGQFLVEKLFDENQMKFWIAHLESWIAQTKNEVNLEWRILEQEDPLMFELWKIQFLDISKQK